MVLSVVGFLLAVAPSSYAKTIPRRRYAGWKRMFCPVVLACGFPLSVTYDGDSLRKEQSGTSPTTRQTERLQCEEPLRYIWYACRTEAGKAAVKQARISKVVCKGVAGATGSLTLSQATITVGRAFEERKSHLRSRREFRITGEDLAQAGIGGPIPGRRVAQACTIAQSRDQHQDLLPDQR